jgi:hypothetical protein
VNGKKIKQEKNKIIKQINCKNSQKNNIETFFIDILMIFIDKKGYYEK